MPPFIEVFPPALEPSPYGLIPSARTPQDGNTPSGEPIGDRWINGFAWVPQSCGGGGGIIDVCLLDAPRDLDGAGRPGVEEYQPFIVWEPDRCNTLTPLTDREERARARLLACETKRLERELWTGERALAEGWPNRFLASPDAAVLNDAALPLRRGLAALEAGLADCLCGGPRMIHAPVDLVIEWGGAGLLRREGLLVLTLLNTIVVPGAGYPGTGPDGAPATDEATWAYGTALVDVRRGPIEIPGTVQQRIDRSVNLADTIAQRAEAATFDPCCLVAQAVDLTVRT